MPPAPTMPSRIIPGAADVDGRLACANSAGGISAAATGIAAEDRNSRRFTFWLLRCRCSWRVLTSLDGGRSLLRLSIRDQLARIARAADRNDEILDTVQHVSHR